MVQAVYGIVPSIMLLNQSAQFAERVHGPNSIQYGIAILALAQAMGVSGDLQSSYRFTQLAIKVLGESAGPEAQITMEGAQFLQHLIRALTANAAALQEAELKHQIAAAPPPKVERVRNLANEERLRKKFPRIAASSAASKADEVVEPVATRSHGEKGLLSISELEQYINGAVPSNGTKASRRKVSK
jgi:hypothetical protein